MPAASMQLRGDRVDLQPQDRKAAAIDGVSADGSKQPETASLLAKTRISARANPQTFSVSIRNPIRRYLPLLSEQPPRMASTIA